jgi:RNA polymerase sigma-70 factor (ECF subfamily)
VDEWVQAVIERRPGADDAFEGRYRSLVYAAILRTLRGASTADPAVDAEDLVQDVFLRLFRDDLRLLRTYDPARASFSTWISIVARSAALAFLRRKRPAMQEFDAEAHAPVRADETPAAAPAIPAGIISARQHLVLQMLFDRSMSVEEVAQVLAVEAQTVRSLKHKALERLRAHFGAEA